MRRPRRGRAVATSLVTVAVLGALLRGSGPVGISAVLPADPIGPLPPQASVALPKVVAEDDVTSLPSTPDPDAEVPVTSPPSTPDPDAEVPVTEAATPGEPAPPVEPVDDEPPDGTALPEPGTESADRPPDPTESPRSRRPSVPSIPGRTPTSSTSMVW